MPEQLGLLDALAGARAEGRAAVVIRSSDRARRLTLKLVPPYAIELVVPRRTAPAAVEEFLRSNRAWIERARHALDAQYPRELRLLPSAVELPAIGRRWEVRIGVKPSSAAGLRERGRTLELVVPRRGGPEGYELLRRWLLGQGRAHLRPWLAQEAERVGVAPRGVQIRTQRTRWGSCSQTGNISLNAAALLLPASLVRYLLVHELCHLRHLNHSARYWRLVARYEPDYEALDRALAAAWIAVPVWALPG